MNFMTIITGDAGRGVRAVLVWMGTRVAGQTTAGADFCRFVLEPDDAAAGGIAKVLPCLAMTTRAFSVRRCVDRARRVISVTGCARGVLGIRSPPRQHEQ